VLPLHLDPIQSVIFLQMYQHLRLLEGAIQMTEVFHLLGELNFLKKSLFYPLIHMVISLVYFQVINLG